MNGTEKQLRPANNWSKASLLFVLIGWGCFAAGVPLVLVLNYLEQTGESTWTKLIVFLLMPLALIWLILNLLGFICGVIAVFQILFRRTFLKEAKKAFAGITLSLLVSVPIFLFVLYVNHTMGLVICGNNMTGLGKGILIYAADFQERFPEPNKWCDLLIDKEDFSRNQFRCKSYGYKSDQLWSSYAINPNCNAHCPNDVVLMFETKPGWNQYGGPELLTLDNHNGKGANILFNDGFVKYIRKKDIGKLKWKAEDVNSVK
jgi:prepilin-type processing-associated H-X9-DG protein